MLKWLEKFFPKTNTNPSSIPVDFNTIYEEIYQNIDSLSFDELQDLLSKIQDILQQNNNSFIIYKENYNNILNLLLKMNITPEVQQAKYTYIYNHFDTLFNYFNFNNHYKKIINNDINNLLENIKFDETIKITFLNTILKKVQFKLNNVNKILELNHFDLLYIIISQKLYDANIEINYKSFLLFNKNVNNLNYATLQVKRKKLGEFLKFLFQKYEGTHSKNDIELLLRNKVFVNNNIVKKKKDSKKNNFSLDNVHKKDFLIPVHLLEVFEECSSIREVIIQFFGTYNKRLEKLVINAFFKDAHINYDIFAWGLLIQPLNINIDVVSNHLENKEFPLRLYQEDDLSIDTSILQYFYNDKRILKLIANITKEDILYFKDTLSMINIIKKYNEKSSKDQQIKRLVKKPKHFKEIHDFLSIITTQIKQKNFKLDNQDKIIYLEKYSSNKYSVKVPLMNYDLIEIGQKLSICVGGGHYGKKIKENESLIFTVFINNKLHYCIEVDPNSLKIIQAKASFNKNIPKNDFAWILETLLDFKSTL